MVAPMRIFLENRPGELLRREGDALAEVRRAAQDDLRKADPSAMFDDNQALAIYRHAEALFLSRQREIVDDVLSRVEGTS